MNNLKSYTEYAVTTPTTDFVIGFDFNYGTDAVNVTVDGVPATDAGYSVIYLNSTTMQLSPAVPSGVVRLQRETDIDAPDNLFTAGAKFIASNMDENFTQIRHSQQEVRDGFSKLSDDTYAIIDTLQDVGQAAQDAADAAEQAAITANDAAAQVNDKVSYQDLDNAIAATPHNTMSGRDTTGAHPASAISYGEINQEEANDGLETVAELLTIQNPINGMRIYVKSYQPVNYASANPYFAKGGGNFVYDASKSNVNDGGVILNGWVRQNTDDLNAFDFGCYGNWDATNQTGDDDTVPLQKYIDYVCNKPDLRQGGVRVARLLGGNYRISALNISRYWGFTLLGEKYFTNIWVDPTGTGIDVSVEGSNFKDITFNGKLNASYHSVGDPSIDYIFKFKLTNGGFDIDTVFTDCNVAWAKNFARCAGRGFNWVGGGAGQTVGNLCDIACDADLTPSGSDQYQLTQSVMRHYKFENARCDQLGAIFNIIGTNAVKEYINGIKVTGCELVGVNRVISGLDCRIVKPLLANNKGYGGFTNIISVPRAVDVQDIGNDWNPVPSMDSLVTTHKIPSAYVFSDSLDGFTLMSNLRNVSNNLIVVGQGSMSGQVNGSGNVENVTITGSKLKNFADGSAWANVINNTGTSKSISIQGNTLTSDVSTRKRWIVNPTNPESIVIDNNITIGSGFDNQRLSYTPTIYVDSTANPAGLTIVKSDASYYIKDNFVYVDFLISLSAQPATGVLSFTLPNITPVVLESLLSGRIAGFGKVTQSYGVTTELSIEVWTTTNRAVLRVHNADFNLSNATGGLTVSGSFRYKFK